MGVLKCGSFRTSHICCIRSCLGGVANGAMRAAPLQSSCGSDVIQKLFPLRQSCWCTGHQGSITYQIRQLEGVVAEGVPVKGP